MIRILADMPGDAERINDAIGGSGRVLDVANRVIEDDADIDCLVVAWRRQFSPEMLDRLEEIERRIPWVPVVLVTDREGSALRLLRSTRAFALVRFADLQNELQSRIEAARSTAALWHLAEAVRRSTLPPALRRALVRSLRQGARRPFRNVMELADAVHCSPVTLFQQFRQRVAEPATLNRLLGGVVILRARQLRDSGLDWKTASARLGIHRGTLNRKSKTWPGCTLGDLDRIAPDQLLAAFATQHVRPLLEGPTSRDGNLRPDG